MSRTKPKKRSVGFLLVILLTLWFHSPTITSSAQFEPLVTLDLSTDGLVLNLDPVLAITPESLSVVENLFLGLTDIDPITQVIVPELATSWVVSDDGLEWTFTLRDDVNWLRYNPITGIPDVVRSVVADDVVYATKRTCNPLLAGYNSTPFAHLIAGCEVINSTVEFELTEDVIYGDTVQITAPDDTTVVIRLQYPASFFLAVTPLIRPLPREIVDSSPYDWTSPGTIVTNGPYFLHSITPSQRTFLRNASLALDLQHNGNIERVVYHVVADSLTRLTFYDENRLDRIAVSETHLTRVLNNPSYTDEVLRVFSLDVYFYGFGHRRAPFDNVHVRRAFSAIIDRQAFIEQNQLGRGIPMTHLTPPNVPFAPAINEIGVGFDPRFAQQEMSLAGFPNCEGFPRITILTQPGNENWGTFLVAAAEQYLGCNSLQFDIRILPPFLTPEWWEAHIWTANWRPHYPDTHNWIGDVLSCDVNSPLRRRCTSVDQKIQTAAIEQSPVRRTNLYAEIEADFFEAEGEYPIAPIFVRGGIFLLVQTWLDGPFQTDGQYGGIHWDAYQINLSEKAAARAS